MFWRWGLIKHIPSNPWMRFIAILGLIFIILYLYKQVNLD